MFIYPEDLDKRLGWKLGRAERLARQRRLPYVLLPDGSIAFRWEEIEPLIVCVPAIAGARGHSEPAGHVESRVG